MARGIPTGGLTTGTDGVKTVEEAARWGGTAGIPYDPCHQQACDDVDNSNDEALDVNADALAFGGAPVRDEHRRRQRRPRPRPTSRRSARSPRPHPRQRGAARAYPQVTRADLTVRQRAPASPRPLPPTRLAVVATTTAPPRPASARRTTIALKILMAATGLVFVGYVLLHMYGNLKALRARRPSTPTPSTCGPSASRCSRTAACSGRSRVVLIVSLVGHGYAAFSLWARAGNARRSKYAAGRTAMRTAWMRWGGVFLLLFIVWHLLHFTILKISPNAAANGPDVENNPYRLVVASFQVPWMTLIYVLAMVALALHLAHGVFSAHADPGVDRHAEGVPPRAARRERHGGRHRRWLPHPAARHPLRPDQVRH